MTTNQTETITVDKLTLYSLVDAEKKRFAKLTWGIRAGYPRLTVYTNHQEFGTGNVFDGIITAPMDMVVLGNLLQLLEQVANGDSDVKYKVDCFNAKWVDGQRTDERYLQATIMFGKDKEGLVWLSVIENKKPKIKFNITISDYINIYKSDGSQLSASEASCMAARSYVKIVRKTYDRLITDSLIDTAKRYTAKPKESPVKQNTATSLPDDDDIPF